MLSMICVVGATLVAQTTSWTRPMEPVLQPGGPGAWDDVVVYAPRFLKRADGRPYVDATGFYYMFYTGTGRATVPRDETGLVRSRDLSQWERVSSTRPVLGLGPDGSYDQGDVSAVTVLEYGGTFHMWFEGNGRVVQSDYVTINYATSQDAIAWTRFVGNPVLRQGDGDDSEDLYAPIVIKDDDGTWKMWYTGHDVAGRYGLMHASAQAPEGPWRKARQTFVFYPGDVFPSEVWKEDGVFHMLYMLANTGFREILLATSIDGIEWIPRGAVFGLGPVRAWDSRSIRWPSQIPVDGGWTTAYYGFGFGQTGIGIATSRERYGFVSGGTGAPGPPIQVTASVSGHRARVMWSPPLSGDPVETYRLETGTRFGAVDAGSVDVDGAAREIVLRIPDGAYYVRIRASNGTGTGPASHDVPFRVGRCPDDSDHPSCS